MKGKIKCVVVSGEEHAVISKILKEYPNIHVEQFFSSGEKFIDYNSKHASDLLIINADILSGNLQFLQQNSDSSKKIILSADKNLAEEGYDYNISGFLSLPLDKNRLIKVLKKTEEEILTKEWPVNGAVGHPFLFIRAEYKLMKINFDDILYIEGLKDYSKIYTRLVTNKAIITLQNLKSFEEKLSSEDFIRVHRSYIVSLSQIEVIHKNSILIGKTEIPVSDGFRSRLHSVISKYM